MEHLPWVKPKSERYFRSQSATDYGMQPSHEFNMECGHGDNFIMTLRELLAKSDMERRSEGFFTCSPWYRPSSFQREREDDLVELERIKDLIEDFLQRLRQREMERGSEGFSYFSQWFLHSPFQREREDDLVELERIKDLIEDLFQRLCQLKGIDMDLVKRERVDDVVEPVRPHPFQSRKITKQLEENRKWFRKSTKQLEENQKQLEESTRQFQENKKWFRKSTKQLEENQKRLEESTRQLEESTWQLKDSTWQLKENKKRLEESTWQLKKSTWQLEENQKRFEESTWQLKENNKRLEESTWQLEENQKRFEESTWQSKENKKLLEESTWQLRENKKRLEESTRQLEESTWQLEESTRQLEESTRQLEKSTRQTTTSTKQEGTHRLVQPHQEPIARKYKPRPQLSTYWILSWVLTMMQLAGLCCGSTGNTVDCLTRQSVLLGSQEIIRCKLFANSTRFYWFDMNIEGSESLLIKLENGRINGIGYTTGEFNIDSDGSLIINSVTVQHERVYHFESVSPSLIRSTNDITVVVYVEPIEPIPVITECLGKSDCIMKGNLDGVISCVHHNTRPAATISWFMRDGTHDIPLNSTTNQTLSADLITFSVTSEMAIGEIPLLVNMQSLVLLVCKSHNPFSVVQESDSKVLLDLSQKDPFEKQPDPVYAIQNQDLVIECPLTITAEDSIVMWMAKSLEIRNSVYLTYLAYSVVPSVETNEQISIDKSGDLVISQVGLHHDGLYACIQSTGSTTKSFLQRAEVIVQPTPPKVLVEGCNLFEPCSFHITETKAITCKVNGVHPNVELKITVMSTNIAVINTKVLSYEDEGLFYTSIRGDVILVDASCQENGTIICQAVGPAANVFKSHVYISISSNVVKCPQISAAPFPAEKEVQINPGLIICSAIAVILLYVLIAFKVIRKCFLQPNGHRQMQAVPVMEPNSE